MNESPESSNSDPRTDGESADTLTWFVRGLILLGLLIMTVVLYRQGFSTGTAERESLENTTNSTSNPKRFEKSNPVLKKRPGAWENRSPEVRRLLRRLEVVPVQPRSGFADGRLKGLDGKVHRLRELRNRWVLVNFWATWCPPCREEMPSLQRLSDRLSDRSFRLIAIDVRESPRQVRSFLKQQNLRLPVWIDATGNVSDSFAVTGLPVSWIISPEGRVLGRIRGPREWDRAPALDLFDRLLREPNG